MKRVGTAFHQWAVQILLLATIRIQVMASHSWRCPRLDLAYGQARVLGRGSFYGAVKESCQHSLPDTGLRIFCPEETFCATEMVYQPILKVPTGAPIGCRVYSRSREDCDVIEAYLTQNDHLDPGANECLDKYCGGAQGGSCEDRIGHFVCISGTGQVHVNTEIGQRVPVTSGENLEKIS